MVVRVSGVDLKKNKCFRRVRLPVRQDLDGGKSKIWDKIESVARFEG